VHATTDLAHLLRWRSLRPINVIIIIIIIIIIIKLNYIVKLLFDNAVRLTSTDGEMSWPLSCLQACPLCITNKLVSTETAVSDVFREDEEGGVETTRVGHVTRMRTPACCNHIVTIATTTIHCVSEKNVTLYLPIMVAQKL